MFFSNFAKAFHAQSRLLKPFNAKLATASTVLSDEKSNMLHEATKHCFTESYVKHDTNVNLADTFGLIAKEQGINVFERLNGFEVANEEQIVVTTKNEPYWFHNECKMLAKNGKIDECVNLLTHQMLKVEKVRPQEYNFSVVIGALGRVGDVHRAYALYYKLKDYGLTPSLSCITSLFNVVGNSSSKEDLVKINKLKEELKAKNVRLHRNSYGALMKAYARHGSFEETIGVFNEALQNGFEPNDVYFTILLKSCKNNQKNGFLHAIQVWKMMLQLGIIPSGPVVTAFLQTMKHSGIGNTDLANQVLFQNSKTVVPDDFIRKTFRQFMWLKGQKSAPRTETLDHLSTTADVKKLPLHQPPRLLEITTSLNVTSGSQASNIAKISSCTEPSLRLDLGGGYTSVLSLLQRYNIQGNSKIFTALAEVMPDSYEFENHLISVAEKSKCELDVDFYNCIMKKRFMRRSDHQGQEIWNKIDSQNLQRNCRSWCIYAISIRNFNAGKDFISEITSNKVRPTNVMMQTLIFGIIKNQRRWRSKPDNAFFYPDYAYLSFLMSYMKNENMVISPQIISYLETAATTPKSYNKWCNPNPRFEHALKKFQQFYSKWLEEIKVKT